MVKKQIAGGWLAQCPICVWTFTATSEEEVRSELKNHLTSKHRGASPPRLSPDLVRHVEGAHP
ncbi:MAG: DUF1059 domain-containing protein [Chloroflexota bacterium]|nr:DUF1059 domain-containing protein [Candidatus Sulfotelmatobacter sp.]